MITGTDIFYDKYSSILSPYIYWNIFWEWCEERNVCNKLLILFVREPVLAFISLWIYFYLYRARESIEKVSLSFVRDVGSQETQVSRVQKYQVSLWKNFSSSPLIPFRLKFSTWYFDTRSVTRSNHGIRLSIKREETESEH